MADQFLVDIAHKKDLLTTASGDLATISGIENLRNALYHRLITSPGSLIHRPTFGVGIKDFQNTLNRLQRQRELALRIQEQFESDPRVEEVSGVLVNYDEQNPTMTTIRVRVKAIGQDELPMTFTPFGDA